MSLNRKSASLLLLYALQTAVFIVTTASIGCQGCSYSSAMKAMIAKVNSHQGIVHGNSINLRNSDINDDEFALLLPGLSEMNSIHLTLSGTNVTDKSIRMLSQISDRIHSLDLVETKVTNDGMALLTEYNNLTSLSIGYTQITDEGVLHLAKIKSIRFLQLPEGITDKSLTYLEHSKNMISLSLPPQNKSLITINAIRKLKVTLPDVKVWMQFDEIK